MERTKINISVKSQEIPPFLVMDVLERAVEMSHEGRDVIHLEVGEPDFDTPANITHAGIEAMKQGHTHYTPSTGIPLLRKAIAQHYKHVYDVTVDPECVIVTSGSSPGALPQSGRGARSRM